VSRTFPECDFTNLEERCYNSLTLCWFMPNFLCCFVCGILFVMKKWVVGVCFLGAFLRASIGFVCPSVLRLPYTNSGTGMDETWHVLAAIFRRFDFGLF
jgi:hypothetical protein